ncbi:MAG: peptidoglycan-binding domain-containing protein [Deltaproteobacteria bacterium]
MRHLHSRLLSTGLWMALSVGSLAAVSSTAFAADERIQTNANGEVLSPASTKILQRQLAAHHAYQGKIDGVWGKQTEAALRNFQVQNKLEATGRVDAPTAEKLGVKIELMAVGNNQAPSTQAPSTQPVAGPNTTDDASTSVQLSALSNDQAKQMQQRLQLLGYYKGPIDGTTGEGTRSALRNFFEHQASLASKGLVSNAAISLFGTQPNDIQRVSGSEKH